jgi:hypothetical protein
VPKDHILARKATDLDAVRHLAAHPSDLIKIVLNSFGGKATADQIQQVLVPTSSPTTGKNGGKPPSAK